MKKCPFCAEEVQSEAVKCKHCGEFFDERMRLAVSQTPSTFAESARPKDWYFKTTFIVVMFLCVGPLALPLVWMSPYIKTRNKWIITIIAGVLSYYSFVATMKAIASIKEYYHQLTSMYK